MAQGTNTTNSLIQSTRRIDPKLADLLTLMNKELVRIANKVDPPPIIFTGAPSEDVARPLNVTTFDYVFTRTNIILFWEPPQDGFLMYEIRTNSSTFSDGDRVTSTPGISAILDPNDSIGSTGALGLVGDRTYTIKAFNEEGEDSPEEDVLIVTVPPLGVISISPNVINNQVILQWTEPTSTFNIDHYQIYKNGNLVQDNIRGTFYVIQEIAGGVFTYGIKAIDLAGNQSPLATVTLDVNDPSDFEVQNETISTFNGTRINTVVEQIENSPTLLACVNDPETYEDHFLSRFWNTPQQQIDAGFPIFIQPAAEDGSYTEIIDFGSNFSNNIISYSWQYEMIVSDVTISVSTRTSTDGMSWSSPILGTQIFVAGPMRYIEVTLNFEST